MAFIAVALVFGCGRRTEPGSAPSPLPTSSPPASTSAAPPAPSGEKGGELPAEWRLPLGWRWETNTFNGFIAAYPGLPLADRETQRLVYRTDRAEYAVGIAAQGNNVDRYRQDIQAQGWTVQSDRALPDGHAFDVSKGELVSHARFVRGTQRSFHLSFTSAAGDDRDAALFLEKFTPLGASEKRRIRVRAGAFSVVVPSRVSEWEERSAEPAVRGVAGLHNGVQFAAAFSELSAGAVPSDALDEGLHASLEQFGGTTLSQSGAPFRGYPSIRVEHRGREGVYMVRRLVAAHGKLIDVASYAPGGTEPTWADDFVDSLELE